MDGSPLTLVSSHSVRLCGRSSECFVFQAQSHALKASKANTPAAAIHEHDLAAGQFATAAKGIDDTSEVQPAMPRLNCVALMQDDRLSEH